MPKQTNNVQVADNGDGTAAITIGLTTYTVDIADLFDRSFNSEDVKKNLRLAYLIGGYAQPDSVEFRNYLQAHGVETREAKYTLLDITLTDADTQTYAVTFRSKKNGDFTLSMDRNDFEQDIKDMTLVIKNINPFLRVGNHTSLTPAARNAIKNHAFWY